MAEEGHKRNIFSLAVHNKRPLPCGPYPAGTDWGRHGLDVVIRECVTLELFFFCF